jgi:hypothetical protein
MVTAFDTAVLLEKLKAQGIPMAEDLVEKLALVVLEWTEESVMVHPNPYVKFVAPVLATIKPMIMAEIDKIDGTIGQ